MNFKIALTGATGWFGQCFIKRYVEENGLQHAATFLYLFSSDGRSLKIPGVDHIFDTYPLENIGDFIDVDILIHSAFLIRNKIEEIGFDQYKRKNTEISNRVFEFSKTNKVKKIFLISSGAARDAENNNDIYGMLKKREEELFFSLKNINVTIFRVFGATGSLVPNIEWSAFTSFIKMAIKQQEIKLEALGVVERSYVSFDALSSLIMALQSSNRKMESSIIDACSENINIYDLARKVAKLLGGEVKLKKHYNPSFVQSNYVGSNEEFIRLCDFFDIDYLTIDKDILLSSKSPYLS